MFCRNCGKELIGTPELCLGCGAKPLAGSSFCHACGAPTDPLAEICVKCGVRLIEAVEKTWRPTTAGILSIVAGAIGLIVGIVVTAALAGATGAFMQLPGWIQAVGAPLIAFGAVAIVGGVFALRRRIWGLALAGAICALVWPMSILGILAIIFIAMSKKEFA